jgi:hypothetical protein
MKAATMPEITDELLDELDAKARAATPGPRRHEFAYNNGGCPTADFYIPGHQGGASVEMMVADAEFICATDPQTVSALTAMVRKLRDEAQRHAHARAAAEDELDRTKAKLEADLTEMTTKRRESQEQTGRYAALAAHDDAQARATLERHGMPEFYFGCDTLDHVCEALVASRSERPVFIAEMLDLKRERDEARVELAQMRFSARTTPPKHLNGGPSYFVMRQRETDPWEVSYFTERDDAVACFDYAGAQWTFTFLLVPLERAEKAEAERDAAKRHGEECARALEAAHDRLKSMRAKFEASQSDEEKRLAATCAQMRVALELVGPTSDLTSLWAVVNAALATDAGRGYLSPEQVAQERAGLLAERAGWYRCNAELQADKDHLLDAIDKDHTGLAQALSAVVKVIEGFSWVADGRGPYEWDDTRYQKETYNAFQAVAKIIKPALVKSGTLANEAWKTFERGRIVKLGVELDGLRAQLRTLLEGAHRHVTKGHHCKCANVESVVNLDSLTATPKGPCDCGFDELRAFIKAQP